MKRYGHWIALASLWLFHTVNNWLWQSTNVVVLGWDRPAHLLRSLAYYQLLKPLSLDSITQIITYHNFYPPLFHLSAALFYSLFGVSADVAAMANVVYMAVLLFAVYGIGKRMFNAETGLLAAFLVSMFPIVFCLSRYTYTEYVLTSMVTLSVYLLIRTDGFQDKRYSALFGLSVGLGMLAKWVSIAFLGGPLVYVLIKAFLRQGVRWKLGRAKVNWRLLFISAAIGLLVSLFFSYLSRLGTTSWVFDKWASLICWGCVTVVLYWTLYTSNPRLRNLLFAMLLGVGIAAIWYIPNSSYVFEEAWYRAYSEDAAVTVGAVLSTPEVWFTHIKELITQQLSPPYFLMLLMALAVLILPHLRQKPLPQLDGFGEATWLLGLWIVPTLVLFTTFTSFARHARLTTPYLPAVALIMAQGVSKVPWRKVKFAVLAVLVAFGLIQFFVLSYDTFAEVPSGTEINFPLIGPVGLFAGGEFIQWPNSGWTDDGYWVINDIFDRIIADSSARKSGPIQIGQLVSKRYLNGAQAQFVAASQYPTLSVIDFKYDGGLPMYPQLFAMDYIVLLRSGGGTEYQVQTIVEMIKNPSDPFHKESQLLDEFPLPNGDAAQLYANKGYHALGHIPEPTLQFTQVGQVQQVNFADKILFVGYTPGEVEASKGKLALDLYWVCLEPTDEDYMVSVKLINGAYHVWGQQDDRPGGLPTNRWERGQAIKDHREMEILPGTLPGSYLVEVTLYDPHRQIELKSKSDGPLLLGPITIPPYAPPRVESLDIGHPVDATLGGKVRLLGYNMESGFWPGDNIHLTLFWQALMATDEDYTVFIHLTDAKGHIWGQKDNPPVDGFYPTTGWEAGMIVRDQYDIPISSNTPPGEYQIEVGMYLRETGERLSVSNDKGQIGGDKIYLGTGISIK